MVYNNGLMSDHMQFDSSEVDTRFSIMRFVQNFVLKTEDLPE